MASTTPPATEPGGPVPVWWSSHFSADRQKSAVALLAGWVYLVPAMRSAGIFRGFSACEIACSTWVMSSPLSDPPS
eukprot:1465753-Heterocapsa_arctica.AAC.1